MTDRAEDQQTFSEKKYGTPDRWRDIERDMKLPFGEWHGPTKLRIW